MNNIKIFENQEFGAIRTMSDEQGETWFCAKDVCDALQHTNSRRAITKLVDEGDVTKRYTPTSSGEQQMTFINESGLISPSLYDQQAEVLNVTSSEISHFCILEKSE